MKHHRYLSILLVGVVCSLRASADTTTSYIFCGAIMGKAAMPVVMSLSPDDVDVQYFYRAHKTLIPLKVMAKSSGSITLAEQSKGSSAQISLKKDNSCDENDNILKCRKLVGTWKDGKNLYPLTLYVVDPQGADQVLAIADYLRGVESKQVKMGTTLVETVPGAVKNFAFDYRVVQFKNAAKIPALNQQINANSATTIEPGSDADDVCSDLFLKQSEQFDLITENILYVDNRVSGMMPNAAYPLNNEGTNQYYDLVAKTEMTPKNIFINFGKNKMTILSIFFAKKMAEAKRVAAQNASSDNDCRENYQPSQIAGQTYEIVIDKVNKRLGLALVFPHAANACNQDYQYVETAAIAKYLNQKSQLYRYLLNK